ncbi:hypothetical protein ACP4OV_007485 [Aristida adscensionis]
MFAREGWGQFEIDIRPLAYFGGDLPKSFQETAARGICLVEQIMEARDYSTFDIRVMETTGTCLRRVALRGKYGYVLAQNVRDSAFALLYLYDHTIAGGAASNDGSTPAAVPEAAKAVALEEVPANVPDDLEGYFKLTAQRFALLVESLERAFCSEP